MGRVRVEMSYGSGRFLLVKNTFFHDVGAFFLLKILLTIKVETVQCDYNRIVTYLVRYQANHVTHLRHQFTRTRSTA